jgi:uncharacterized phage infection (PIP) family protein YhgE
LIEDSVSKVEAGYRLVETSGDALQQILSSVKRVTDFVGEIAAASREQSTGIDQVNSAVTQMDQVTQTNAAQTEELSGTAEELAQQGRLLLEVVAQFNLKREGRSLAVSPLVQTQRRALRPELKQQLRRPPMRQAKTYVASETRHDVEVERTPAVHRRGSNGSGLPIGESELDSNFEEI